MYIKPADWIVVHVFVISFIFDILQEKNIEDNKETEKEANKIDLY